MGDKRITINEIHDIESITINDLGVSYIEDSRSSLCNGLIKNGEELIIPMVSVAYDGANVIVLDAKEEEFNYFVKKVRDIYLKEKDKPIEGSITKRTISIDENSKKLLLSDTLTKTSDMYSHYKEMDSFDESLIADDKETKSLLPLIEYIVKSNLSMLDKTFTMEHDLEGYAPSGNYTTSGYIDGYYYPIPLFIIKGKNSYSIRVGNVFGELHPLEIIIDFKKTRLDIISKVDTLGYYQLESFEYENGVVKNEREVYSGNKCVYIDPIILDTKIDTPSISKIDEDDTLDWFRMPWGASLGFKVEEKVIDEDSKAILNKIQYIDSNDNTFINLVSAEKRYNRRSLDFRRKKDIVYDDVDKTMVGFKDNDTVYIETSFKDDGAVGEYKEKYAGKNFYHFSKELDFNKIDNTNVYPVSRDYDVYEPGDLIDNYKIKTYSRGL